MKKASSNKVKGNWIAEFQLFSELPFTLTHSDFLKKSDFVNNEQKTIDSSVFLVYHKLFIKCPLCIKHGSMSEDTVLEKTDKMPTSASRRPNMMCDCKTG